jgi:pimeloyl-ACP methyl ester carboxylesterase
MPFAKIGPVNLHYEIIGASGPVLALTPGGRRSLNEFLSLADKIARQGFRVLLHDRRNCGISDIYFDRSDAEDSLWAEDLQALLTFIDAGDVFVGGSSSGCRTSILHYLRHPQRVRGLCLFRVTGGPFAAKRLPENYYHRFIAAAREGGMEGVCAIDHWQERFKLRPQDRDLLLSMDLDRYIDVMSFWRDRFLQGVDLPILGVTAAELQSITVPTVIIPGNDMIHSSASGAIAQSLIPDALLHPLPIEDTRRDLIPFGEWAPQEEEIASAFVDLMHRAQDGRTNRREARA